MNPDTFSTQKVFAFEGDGAKSDPITPLTSKELERLKKLRERYVEAGLIPRTAESPTESRPKTK